MQRFPFDFPNIEMVISSRPETDTTAFSIFPVLKLQPLNLERVNDLVQRTEFHDNIKKSAFLEKINGGLFEERKSFLTNPLLCLLMLMTYADNGDIPERAALFYDQAFDTLYSRHDSSKGPFRREYFSGLHKDQFKKVLRVFCYRTLAKHEISFSEMDLKNQFARSVELAEVDARSEDLIKDMLESVCLLQRDGGKIHFIHRSFQEFFAADFLANYRGKNEFAVFDKLLRDPIASRTAALLYDINPELIEEVWVQGCSTLIAL